MILFVLFFEHCDDGGVGSKHQASVNDIENTDQKHSDTAKSSYHDWSSEENKANKGNLMFMTLLVCDLI